MNMVHENVSLTQYLTFHVAGEQYAVAVLAVKEIIEYQPLTRMPSAPAWIRGVMNLRGGVVPVADLALKFGLPAAEITNRTCIVIVESAGGVVMGLLVDAVDQVLDLPADAVVPAPPFGTSVKASQLLGLGKLGPQLVLLLDVERVLFSEETSQGAPAEPDAGPVAEAPSPKRRTRRGAPEPVHQG
jgi:purine-binding chemotaxis protein CheW